MTRKLIGTGITDENGEATITYTGTGAGRLNIVAESGTFVSPPYPIEDCLISLNNLNSNNINDYFIYWNSNANTLSTDGDWKIIETDASKYSSTYMQNGFLGFNGTYVDLPMYARINVNNASNYVLCCHVRKSDSTTDWNSLVLENGAVLELICANDKLCFYKNGNKQPFFEKTISGSLTINIYLQSTRANGNGYIKFKDFQIYRREVI